MKELKVKGFFSIKEKENFEEDIDKLKKQGFHKIVINLKESFGIDNSGIKTLIYTTQNLKKENKNLILKSPNENLREIIRKTKICKYLIIE